MVTVFRCFPIKKSRKQNTETEQAQPQLQFAPKIIKIHLVVLENELIEVCMLVPKTAKTASCVYVLLLLTKGPLPKFQYTYIRAMHVTVFSTFLKLAYKLQSTRSPRLPNGF